MVNLNLGGVYLQQNDSAAADASFKAALQDDPSLETTIRMYRQRIESQ